MRRQVRIDAYKESILTTPIPMKKLLYNEKEIAKRNKENAMDMKNAWEDALVIGQDPRGYCKEHVPNIKMEDLIEEDTKVAVSLLPRLR